MSAYLELESRFRRMALIGDAGSMLGWDRAAMMPEGGNGARSEVVATLRVLRHEMLTDTEVGDLMDEVGGDNRLDDWQRANLAEMRRWRLHATAVPADLVAAISRATSESEMVWRKARPASDLAMLMPHLKKVLELTREKARIKAAALGIPAYEALMDEYEPSGRTERIDAIFDDYAAFLPDFLERVLTRQASRPPPIRPPGPFPIDRQKALGEHLMKVIGFDFAHGRLDVSAHPFCGGVPDDVRITTRYSTDDFTQSLMGVLHETGHAMYERQLPERWRWQPVGEARGMSVHESQSLLIEMQVCRGPEFMAFAAPLMREAFGGSGPAWETDNLRRIYAQVGRSFIRVEADEVTYPAHVILRYRLEKRLIAGDLRLEEVPGAWSEELKRLLGIVPPDDRRGCLQDIHWPEGIFGYFPTYSLGAMTAAQLFDAAKRADASILPAIATGEFAPLMGWLKAHVHGQGSKLSTDELLTRATGRSLDPAVFKAHLTARYLS
ncbi:MAG: carboxypeptidase M32 [Alphaproteobacteria bacterium]|nr:carboxypeptidase M32 [Alphaproteobacteria bacterium]